MSNYLSMCAEVHHRVKNNLAVMSALMELEQSESDSPEVKRSLSRMQSRVKSMAAVHEILYRSDDLNRISLTEFMPGILSLASDELDVQGLQLGQDLEELSINVNQALTYALLINELMELVTRLQVPSGSELNVRVRRYGSYLKTGFRMRCNQESTSLLTAEYSPLVGVLLQQLNARMLRIERGRICSLEFSFELADKKGIVGNLASNQL